jgi:hypothetical protein
MSLQQKAHGALRDIDPRLVALAENDGTLRRWIDTATRVGVSEPERRAAVRSLQVFLALTPMPSEGWAPVADCGAPKSWRRTETKQ